MTILQLIYMKIFGCEHCFTVKRLKYASLVLFSGFGRDLSGCQFIQRHLRESIGVHKQYR